MSGPVRPPEPHAGGARPPAIPPELLPRHVALVMDGNGRWAKERGLPRTEGHKRGEAALFDHRNVAELADRHALHDLGHSLARSAGDDLAGHHFADRALQCLRALLGERAHDVALRQDADDAAIGARDDHRADAVRGQQLHGVGQRGVRFRRDDVGTFA